MHNARVEQALRAAGHVPRERQRAKRLPDYDIVLPDGAMRIIPALVMAGSSVSLDAVEQHAVSVVRASGVTGATIVVPDQLPGETTSRDVVERRSVEVMRFTQFARELGLTI